MFSVPTDQSKIQENPKIANTAINSRIKIESYSMNFVTGLPRTPQEYDTIWVIFDRLTKFAHFLPIRINYSMDKLVQIYLREIVQIHGVSESIVSDRDHRFQSRFWRSLSEVVGTKLQLSTTAHPQTDR